MIAPRILLPAAAILDGAIAALVNARRALDVVQSNTGGLPLTIDVLDLRGYADARHLRSRWFGDIFSDPSWSMLIELALAEQQHRELTVSGLAYSAEVAGTTGLRRLQQLVDLGLVERVSSPLDARIQVVRLTAAGRDAWSGYLGDVLGGSA